MHTHIGVLLGVPAFLSVVLAGTLWRLLAGYFVKSTSPSLQHLGGAMVFQY